MSESKFKIEFKLKQHTPMIHFQSDQKGATLRATELKPKFDRFLLEYVEGIPFKENANGHKSLDYKVKIGINNSKSTTIDKRDPLFFGNMGDSKDKEFKKNLEIFCIEFFSFNTEVFEAIKNNFEAFLANTNFGTRQSKGFGSFYLVDENTEKTIPFKQNLIKEKVYSFSSSISNWDKDIKLFYSFLRQGINLPNKAGTRFYSKPAIFLYAQSKGWTWDKKAIKEHFFKNELNTQKKKYSKDSPVNYSGDKNYLLRDLFGLSSSQQWGKPYSTSINKEHKEIERFKSPITFKFVDGRVYFWSNGTEENMLNKSFQIIIKGKMWSLNTPSSFNFNDFFEFVKSINLSSIVDQRFHSQPEYKDLSRMLQNIKASK